MKSKNSLAEKTALVNFVPRQWQYDVEQIMSARNKLVLNVHRGGGKTRYATARLCMAALLTEKPDGSPCKFAYIGKSMTHAKSVVWDDIQFLLRELIEAKQVQMNGNDLTIKFLNGNIIHLLGIDDPERIRGLHVSGLILDEAQLCDLETWNKIIMPTTVQNKAWQLLIGTPSGPQGIFYHLWCIGNDPKQRSWTSVTLTVDDTGCIDPEVWEDILATTDHNAVQQEYYCSFDAAISNRVYYNFDTNAAGSDGRDPHLRTCVDDGKSPLHIGMDFNVAFLPAVVAQIRANGDVEIIEEIALRNATTDMMCEAIKLKYPGRTIYVYPDASGANAGTAQVHGSNHALIRAHGFVIISPAKNPKVSDRVQAVNIALQNAKGERKLFINHKCKHTIETLSFQELNEHTGQPDKTKGLDHMADAIGYLVSRIKPLRSNIFKQRTLRF